MTPRRAAGIAATGLATGLYLSLIPVKLSRKAGLRWRGTGAGLVGTLWGLALLPWVPTTPGRWAAFYAAALAASVFLCGEAERRFGVRDDQRIVLDETVGFWAACAFLPRAAAPIAAAFILFRALDSLKPPPIPFFERLPGGWGVVFDDVVAGAMANLVIRACIWSF